MGLALVGGALQGGAGMLPRGRPRRASPPRLGEGRAPSALRPSQDAASVAQRLLLDPLPPRPPSEPTDEAAGWDSVAEAGAGVARGEEAHLGRWSPPLQPSGSLQGPHSLAGFGGHRFRLVLLPEQQLPGEWEVL